MRNTTPSTSAIQHSFANVLWRVLPCVCIQLLIYPISLSTREQSVIGVTHHFIAEDIIKESYLPNLVLVRLKTPPASEFGQGACGTPPYQSQQPIPPRRRACVTLIRRSLLENAGPQPWLLSEKLQLQPCLLLL